MNEPGDRDHAGDRTPTFVPQRERPKSAMPAGPTAIKRYRNLLPVAIYADERNKERIANALAD